MIYLDQILTRLFVEITVKYLDMFCKYLICTSLFNNDVASETITTFNQILKNKNFGLITFNLFKLVNNINYICFVLDVWYNVLKIWRCFIIWYASFICKYYVADDIRNNHFNCCYNIYNCKYHF